MKPLRLSSGKLAATLHVPVSQVTGLIRERRNVDAEMALRLQQYFGISAAFWLNWQRQYDLDLAEGRLAKRIRREIRPAPRDAKTGELTVPKNAGPHSTRTLRALVQGKLSTRSRQQVGANSLRMTD